MATTNGKNVNTDSHLWTTEFISVPESEDSKAREVPKPEDKKKGWWPFEFSIKHELSDKANGALERATHEVAELRKMVNEAVDMVAAFSGGTETKALLKTSADVIMAVVLTCYNAVMVEGLAMKASIIAQSLAAAGLLSGIAEAAGEGAAGTLAGPGGTRGHP